MTAAAASETTGGCEATAPTPSWVSRLASRPVSSARKRAESQVIARLTASDSGERAIASGHADLPSGQGNAYADGGTGSGQQTTTDHATSGRDRYRDRSRRDRELPRRDW